MAAPVTITFLGGLGEIGRNCAALECEGRIVLLDCGQLFPDDLPGVDAVLPDFTWLLERADRLEACLITHAHEDHIGGLPYLLRHLEVPIYGSPFTLGMVSPDGREGMLEHATQFAEAGIPFIFDPGQGLPLFSGDELLDFIDKATWICVTITRHS
jgi:ribonuclease J